MHRLAGERKSENSAILSHLEETDNRLENIEEIIEKNANQTNREISLLEKKLLASLKMKILSS